VATIDARSVTLAVRVPSSQPTVTPDPGPPVGFKFDSPTIDADASMRLTETTRESVANWTLGFIQLKYIGINHARYRGTTVRDGSALVSYSNQILCRDTDIGSTEVWYDSLTLAERRVPWAPTSLPQALSFHQPTSWKSVHTCSTNLPAGGPPSTPTPSCPAPEQLPALRRR
jgi:hypothetical protein